MREKSISPSDNLADQPSRGRSSLGYTYARFYAWRFS
jgi:hypothetical protein